MDNLQPLDSKRDNYFNFFWNRNSTNQNYPMTPFSIYFYATSSDQKIKTCSKMYQNSLDHKFWSSQIANFRITY